MSYISSKLSPQTAPAIKGLKSEEGNGRVRRSVHRRPVAAGCRQTNMSTAELRVNVEVKY